MDIQIYERTFKVLEFDEIKGTCFGFIYVTVNNITGKRYLGLHHTWKKDYVGSGNYIRAAIRKYGKENFTRYIIDTADSYEDLCILEAYYITEAFGINLAKSRDWYNITSGLQRGGDTWAGMSEEDRYKRVEKLSKALKGRKHNKERVERNRIAQLKRMSDPLVRKHISEVTKKAMSNPEVRKRISEAKKGKKPNYSIEELEKRRERMREVGKLRTNPWNKGVTYSKEVKEYLSKAQRGHFRVTIGDRVICEDLNARGGYKGAADKLSGMLGVKIGRNLFGKLVNTGERYNGNKKSILGLQIERID